MYQHNFQGMQKTTLVGAGSRSPSSMRLPKLCSYSRTSQHMIALPTTSAIALTDDVGKAIFFDSFLVLLVGRQGLGGRLVLLERLYVTRSTLPSVLLSRKDIWTGRSWCLKVSETTKQSYSLN